MGKLTNCPATWHKSTRLHRWILTSLHNKSHVLVPSYIIITK